MRAVMRDATSVIGAVRRASDPIPTVVCHAIIPS